MRLNDGVVAKLWEWTKWTIRRQIQHGHARVAKYMPKDGSTNILSLGMLIAFALAQRQGHQKKLTMDSPKVFSTLCTIILLRNEAEPNVVSGTTSRYEKNHSKGRQLTSHFFNFTTSKIKKLIYPSTFYLWVYTPRDPRFWPTDPKVCGEFESELSVFYFCLLTHNRNPQTSQQEGFGWVNGLRCLTTKCCCVFDNFHL